MKKWRIGWRKKGYVSIETVIVSGIFLSLAIWLLLSFSEMSTLVMGKNLDKLDAFEIFQTSKTNIIYDDLGYPKILKIKAGDINPETDFEFEWSNELNGWSITNYNNYDDLDVVIPSKRSDDLKIVEIGSWAFNYKELTSVAIPNTIVLIDRGSFSSNKIESVIIPNSVKAIGESAFEENWLNKITLEDGLTLIGNKSFMNNELTSLIIPSSVKEIGELAFNLNQIKSIEFNEGLVEIKQNAFEANQLRTVKFPNSLTTLGDFSFHDNQITSYTIGNKVTSMGYGVFNLNNLNSNQEFLYARSANGSEDKKVLNGYGGSKRDVTIPNSVETIGDYAFLGSYINSIEIPTSVTSIGVASFSWNNLTEITIPAGLIHMGREAFAYGQLTSVTFKGALPISLETDIFLNNDDLGIASIRVPANHKYDYQSVAESAFAKDSSNIIGY